MPTTSQPTVHLRVSADPSEPQISRHIFGQFAEHLGRCVYEGLWVGEDSSIPNVRGLRQDVVQALRQIKVPNLRWPGGCFADAYNWRDGIGPRSQRPKIHNNTWDIPEPNDFGTHEFLDLCEQIGCEPVICGNVGSGTVREMRDWLEYLNAPPGRPLSDLRATHGRPEPTRVRYWGVGNESYGCGGNMRPEYYADEFRRYSTFIGSFVPDVPLFRIACGHDAEWNEVMMRECASPRYHPNMMDGLTLHHYVNGGQPPPSDFSATHFDDRHWRLVMGQGWQMKAKVLEQAAIMDKYDPTRRVALIVDEWGAWYPSDAGRRSCELYQQQTIRDAVLAGLTLNIFVEHAERVRMANVAQVANVLQAMVLTFGKAMVRTPSWHVFDLYTPHQDAKRLRIFSDAPQLTWEQFSYPMVSVTASRGNQGSVSVSLVNTHSTDAVPVEITLDNLGPLTAPSGRIVISPELTASNTPDAPDLIRSHVWSDFRYQSGRLTAALPPASVATVQFSPAP